MAETASVPSTGATMVPGPNSAPSTTPQPGKSPAKTAPQVAGKGAKTATNEPQKVEAPVAPEKRTYKIKVLDQERELQLDDEEIKVRIQKAEGADRKFEEAARARKEAEARIKAAEEREAKLKTDAFAVLREMGLDPRKMSEEYLAREIEMEMMDPRERELKETKARLAKIEQESQAKEKERIDREESEKMTKRVQALKDNIAAKISAVMKDSPLPPTERTVSKIAGYMQYAKKNDIPFELADIRERVVQDYREDFAHMFSKAEPAQIAQLLGEDVIKKIRIWDNERVKAQPKTNGATKPQNRYEPKARKYKTIEEDNLERFGSIYALPDSD